MEEVDKIILNSLKNIECDIGNITSLKEFDSDLCVLAISCCLEAVLQNVELPKKLAPSMSNRVKVASVLADYIKNLGFHGDMGYSSILYGSELEIRRILIFLIERLPKDTSKNTAVIETGVVSQLFKDIDQNVQVFLKYMWIPTSFIHNGMRECEKSKCHIFSFGNSTPLVSQILSIPYCCSSIEDTGEYFSAIPEVTDQILPNQILASLLFKDCYFPDGFNFKNKEEHDQNVIPLQNIAHIENVLKINASCEKLENVEQTTEILQEIDKLSSELNDIEQKYISVKEVVKDVQLQLSKLESVKNEKQHILENTRSELKFKTKALAVMNKNDKIEKLKGFIQNSNDRFVELTLQWEQVKKPLTTEYESLQRTISIKENQYHEKEDKLIKLRDTHCKLNKDLKEKNVREDALRQKCQQMSTTEKRSIYTKRIYEIIGNINKQNNEIQKILKDTKALQKEIKILTEQIDRSFTLADELIFHDAKHDEIARKGYKLLAALRDEFNAILKAVGDVGQLERECRNLQEQTDSEMAKEIETKLERVNADLLALQNETKSLMKYSQR